MSAFRMPLHTQILIGMILGIACGLFFGEMMSVFQPLGDAFIMLLKMPILPFMSFSLIHAIGSLSKENALQLFKKSFVFFLGMWGTVLITVYAFSLLFPESHAPIFYSNIEPYDASKESLLHSFIPTNPIHAFANDIIPAVVLFSLLFGVALIQLSSKKNFLGNVKVTLNALTSITHWVAKLSPIGIFALIGSSVGTMAFSEMEKLEAYLVAYILGIFFLCFCLFPLVVNSLTPIRARDFLLELRPALLLAFTTGNVLVSLPYVIEGLEKLRLPHQNKEAHDVAEQTIESMVPIAYNFPTVGNLFGVLFILFLSFFYAHPLSLGEHATLVELSVPVLFGPTPSVINGVSFLIDKTHLPSDGFGLFLETLPITRNFQALGSTTGIAIISLLLAFAVGGGLKTNWSRMGRNGVIALAVMVTMIVFGKLISFGGVELQEHFSSLRMQKPMESRVYRLGEDYSKRKKSKRYESALDRIRERGVLRIGYNAMNMPFSYFNEREELVGHDIAFAHDLANALDARLEFYPFEYGNLTEELNNSRFDIAMSAISITPQRMRSIAFSTPYMEMERALIVIDHMREEFVDYDALKEHEDLTIYVIEGTSFEEEAADLFPNASIESIASYNDFLQAPEGSALLWSREEGTTWSLIHPKYTVVIPSPSLGKEYYAFAIAEHDVSFLDWVNYWYSLKVRDGFHEDQYDYWVLGKRPDSYPRWSIIRDVLHWVD